jgi:hypothetical protein
LVFKNIKGDLMKMTQNIWLIFFTAMGISLASHATLIPYCQGTKVSMAENQLLQTLVPNFAGKTGCEIGNNCLAKGEVAEGSAKFSIAWKAQCGPVINGIYQLGDEGHGSTFVCQETAQTKTVCCWPLGYDYEKSWVVCAGY